MINKQNHRNSEILNKNIAMAYLARTLSHEKLFSYLHIFSIFKIQNQPFLL